MNLTIFAKKRKSSDGREFYSYLSTMTRKDGSELKCSVKFRESCGSPKGGDCPMNIVIDKSNANLSSKELVNEETGEILIVYTLWVSEWKIGEQYVDHSLDDFQ